MTTNRAGDGPLHASGVRVPIARPTHARLAIVARALGNEKGRRVTISEAIDELITNWVQTQRLVEDVKTHE
jgi:hypothetical protein